VALEVYVAGCDGLDVVTLTLPAVAPLGTMVVIAVLETTVNMADERSKIPLVPLHRDYDW